jgi:gamma-glutamyltranspeptidase/glutathione hydrolase
MRKYALFVLAIGSQLLVQAQPVASIVGAGKAIDPYKYTIVKKADYSKASVSSAHPLASLVGCRYYERRWQCI